MGSPTGETGDDILAQLHFVLGKAALYRGCEHTGTVQCEIAGKSSCKVVLNTQPHEILQIHT